MRYLASGRVVRRGQVWEDGDDLTEIANEYPAWRDHLIEAGRIEVVEDQPVEVDEADVNDEELTDEDEEPNWPPVIGNDEE